MILSSLLKLDLETCMKCTAKPLFSILVPIVFLLISCTPPVETSTTPTGSDLVFSLSDGRTVGRPVWSPTGQELAFTIFDPDNGKGEIDIVNKSTHAVRTLVDQDYVRAPSWSPDGKYIAYNYLREIMMVPVDGSVVPRSLTSGQIAAFSPNGKEMAIFDNDGTASSSTYILKILDLETANEKTVFSRSAGNQDIFDLSWSPDNKRLAFSLPPEKSDSGNAQRDIYIYDLETENLLQYTFGDDNFFPTWSPQGNQIAYLHRPTTQAYVSIMISLVDGSCKVEVPNINHALSLAWSPEGSYLAYTEPTSIYLLDLALIFGENFRTIGPKCP